MKLSVVILPNARWAQARRQWTLADEWGLHAGYTYDHLSWRVPFRDGPWFSMVPTLVAAATVTSRLRLGPLVTSPNFRHPLLLAKDLIALDDVSDGRVIVGVGAGGVLGGGGGGGRGNRRHDPRTGTLVASRTPREVRGIHPRARPAAARTVVDLRRHVLPGQRVATDTGSATITATAVVPERPRTQIPGPDRRDRRGLGEFR